MQQDGQMYNFIDYFQDTQKPVEFYAKTLQDKPYVYGMHYLPHDAGHNDHTMTSYEDHLSQYQVNNVIIVPRIADLTVGIDQTRQKLPLCRFDKEKTAKGHIGIRAI